ncbi:MAG: ferritin-like domain-containing protein [Fastidiosipilaceae bacterium]|jgi:rubrerythrin|nr:ferritin family protein [Clostridiaceae bacterium]
MKAFGVSDLLAAMVRLEQTGHQFYTELAVRSEDEEEKNFFSMLAKEELKHEKIYADLAEQYKSVEPENQLDEPYGAYLDILINQNFSFTEEDLKDRETAFKIAVGLEKDTLLFISEVELLIDTNHKEVFEKIKAEERSHLRALVAYRDSHNI